jgi:hypothetical protein
MVWILLAFMIWWDHPNLLTLSFSSYKRRGAFMEKVIFLSLEFWLAWSFWNWLSWIWLGIISLVGVSLSFSFVKIDCV